MHGPHIAPDGHPVRLLDDYVAHARRRSHGSLAATALRTRSLSARHLLARAVGPGSIDDLLAMARGERPGSATFIRSGPSALADLARVVALQNLLPTDQADGLALFDLALDHFGSERIPPARRGLHAQLAYHLGDRARAAALCEQYPGIPDRYRKPLLLDLANPYAGADGASEAEWLTLFQDFFPWPHPTLDGPARLAPFDRLAVTVDGEIAGAEQVTVIVTSFMPDEGLITAVRSLMNQSWSNLEILLVDDASPPEYEPLLKQCVDLDSRVRLLELDTNGGTYRARNAGLDAASGSIVTFEDSDDWSHPGRIHHQVQPLLADRTLAATVADTLAVTDELAVTRPSREALRAKPTSLMFWKDAVLQRVGYFDSVRKAADTEYKLRVEAAFGRSAVHHLDEVYTLHRQRPGSLSSGDFQGGWVQPARIAYWAAYSLWHQRVREGTASPYVPKDPAHRPFAAPVNLDRSAVPQTRLVYDVVYVGDWSQCDGVQRSTLEEIRTLVDRGVRVGIVHIESFRYARRERTYLYRPTQELVNHGIIDRVLLSDQADTSLLIVRHPCVLQFPPASPGNLRAEKLLIQPAEPPFDSDGTDHRYVPGTCTDVARQMFAAAPLWCPQGPAVREVLARELAATDLASFDLPSVIDPHTWRFHRTGFRSGRPVLGRESTGWPATWPADHRTLVEAYPDSPDYDVRVWGDVAAARQLLAGRIPPNWLVYAPDEVNVRSFLHQIDFYVYFPHPQRAESFEYAILEALAAGCVVILPDRFSGTFGDAAVYCAASEVRDVVGSYYADVERFLDQGRRAVGWVRACFGADAYLDRVRSLIAPAAQKPGEEH